MQLTLQAFNDGSWQDAYRLKIEQPTLGKQGRISAQALTQYAVSYFDETGSRSFSVSYPVNPMDVHTFPNWPALIEDIMPMGFTYLEQRLKNWGLLT